MDSEAQAKDICQQVKNKEKLKEENRQLMILLFRTELDHKTEISQKRTSMFCLIS
jgi:hypothetical protein